MLRSCSPRWAAIWVAALLLAACSDSSDDGAEPVAAPERGTDAGNGADNAGDTHADQEFPDVVDVQVEGEGGVYDFVVTISSPYDTPQRYADGWRVVGEDGTVYGEHELAHDHTNEQPFTRTQRDVSLPDDVEEVTIEGRDQANGYGGETMTVELPDR